MSSVADLTLFTGAKQNAVRWLPFEEYGARFLAVTGSWDDENGASALAAWNLEPAAAESRKVGAEVAHDGGVTGIAVAQISATSVAVITSSDLGGLAAYKLTLGDDVRISPAHWTASGAHAGGAATAVVVLPHDQAVVASAGEDGRVTVVSALSGQQLRAVHAEEDTVGCLAATGSCVLASGGRSVRLWDARDLHGACEVALSAEGEGALGRYTCVAFDPTGTLVAAGSSGSVLSVWDVRKANARLCRLQLPHADTPLWELAFPPTAARNMLLSASASGLLQWNFSDTVNTADNFQGRNLQGVRALAQLASPLTFNSLDPHPSEHQVVCVADDDSIQVARFAQ